MNSHAIAPENHFPAKNGFGHRELSSERGHPGFCVLILLNCFPSSQRNSTMERGSPISH